MESHATVGKLSLLSWGANSYGQLALGRKSEQEQVPTVAEAAHLNLDDGARMYGGGGHSVVVSAQGTKLWASGWNKRGQLGMGHKEDQYKLTQVPLPENTRVSQVACGWDFTLVATECGKVLGCGSNSFGQLGMGEECRGVDRLTEIPGLQHGCKALACGLRHSLIVDGSGKLFGCGSSRRGQLGDGERELRVDVKPVQGMQGVKVKAVSAGQHFSVALSDQGDLYCFGDDKFGQLLEKKSQLVSGEVRKISADVFSSPVAQVSCGWTHVVARLDSGDVVGWGRGEYGQLPGGGGEMPSLILKGNCKQLSSGAEHVVALLNDGSLESWGWNEHGNCGDGGVDNVMSPSPVRMPAGAAVQAFCAASGHNLSLVRCAEEAVKM